MSALEQWFSEMGAGLTRFIDDYLDGIADNARDYEDGLAKTLKDYSVIKDRIIEEWKLGIKQLNADYSKVFEALERKQKEIEPNNKDKKRSIIIEIDKFKAKKKETEKLNEKKKDELLRYAERKKERTIERLKRAK